MTVNKANVQKIMDRIAAEPARNFRMELFRSDQSCGTVACIAGWIAKVKQEETNDAAYDVKYMGAGGYVTGGARFLGISQPEAYDLFYGIHVKGGLKSISKPLALATLEILRDRGVVDWKKGARLLKWRARKALWNVRIARMTKPLRDFQKKHSRREADAALSALIGRGGAALETLGTLCAESLPEPPTINKTAERVKL